MNRLNSASESGTGSWSESEGYDTFGNRCVTGGAPGLPPLTNETPQGPGWHLTNNRINGWGYDGAGNITSIPSMSRSYGYDAESRMTSAGVSGTTNYSYDGEGRRVQKVTTSGTTTYVYDAAGQLAAEYSTVATPGTGTEYPTADHLGSTRLVTDAGGNATKCYDYTPFGAEIPSGYGGRSTCFGATSYPGSPDILDIKFTGKERDAETGLDFFGARYMSSAQGRFTSADPKQFPHDITDPQSWNKYSYTRNNPLRYVDPDGEDWQDILKGAINGYTSSNVLNAGRIDSSNSDFRSGQAIGDAVAAAQGAFEFLSGLGGEVGGTALDLTGAGAVVGVPVNVASGVAIVHGGTVATTGLANLGVTLFKNGTNDATTSGPYENTPQNQERMSQGKAPVADSDEENRSFRAEDDQNIAERRW